MDDGAMTLEGVDNAFLLNASQLGMLYHSLTEPGSGVYVSVFSGVLPSDVDIETFQRAWDHVMARHDALRSLYVWEGVDDPLQVVRSTCDITWEMAEAPVAVVEGGPDPAYLETLRREGLDLSQAPAMRFLLPRLDTGERCFLWVCHHALIDDWSQAMVLSEVQTVYRAFRAGRHPDLPDAPSFAEFAEWLEARDQSSDEAYWRQLFSGFSTPTRAEQPRVHSGEPATIRAASERVLDGTASDALRQMASGERVTLATVATAVWSVVMHRLAGEDDLAFGLAATQRPPELDGMDRAIGNFVTTMPVRLAPCDMSSMRDLLTRCHDLVQEAQPRLGMSLTRLNDMLGLKSDVPVFDTILSINQDVLGVLEDDNAPLFGSPSIHFKSHFPLAMLVLPGERIALKAIYDTRRFDGESIEGILDLFEQALIAAPASLSVAPASLRVMDRDAEAAARAGLVADAPLPAFDGVVEEILRRSEEAPGRIALISGGHKVSYGALVDRAGAIAGLLQGLGIGPGQRVGLYLDRSTDVPVAMLGCLMAGVAYVPLDAAFPEKRLERMIGVADVSAILTRRDLMVRLSARPEKLIDLDTVPASHGALVVAKVAGSDTAYVMFTSGSTGIPKGVVVSRANLNASTAARLSWYDAPPESYLLLSSHAFDSSVAGIYWTLVAGGTLCIATQDEAQDVAAIAGLIRGNRIGHMLCLPSLYHLLLERSAGDLDALTTVIVAGEEATPDLVAAHFSSDVSARLFNEYGPTEATVWCAAAELTEKDTWGPVPIGGPVPGTTLFVRDGKGRTVPKGVAGELYVGGAGVASGYLDLPEESEKRFVPNPARSDERLYRIGDLVRQRADGALVYLGRADEQVKLRGYRIELSEVEGVLSGRPDIREAAVALYGAGAAARLVAFIVAKENAALNPGALTDFCKNVLPSYMVPSQFVTLGALPRLPNGKVDRSALPEPKRQGATDRIVEATTQTESVLAEIWQRLLWLDREIGITEDFYDLGGHSLLAMKLVNEIEAAFDLRIPLERLGRLTTVAAQSKLIEEVRRDGSGAAVEPTLPSGLVPNALAGLDAEEERKLRSLTASWSAPEARSGSLMRVMNRSGRQPPLFFCFLSEYSFTQMGEFLGEDQPLYAIRGSNGVVPRTGEDAFEDNMRRTAITYLPEVLELAGDGPIYLGGYCQGATIALYLAAFLTAMGRQVANVISLENTPPLTYAGHVDILITEKSFLNPYLNFDKPEMAWARRYGSHSFKLIPGDYGKVFRPPYVVTLSEAVRSCLARARQRSLAALPLTARKISWPAPVIPSRLPTGARIALRVDFRNESAFDWRPSVESGLRLRADLYAADDETSPVVTSYSNFDAAVSAGQAGQATLIIQVPDVAGGYRLEVDMVEEGVGYFSKAGNATLSALVSVDPDVALDPALAVPDDRVDDEAVGMLSREADALVDRVRARLGHGDLQPEDLQQVAVALGGGAAGLLGTLGASGLGQSDPVRAERLLQAAHALAPENPDTLVALARLKLGTGRPVAAYRLFKRARRLGSLEAKAVLSMYFSPKGLARQVKRRIKEKKGAT